MARIEPQDNEADHDTPGPSHLRPLFRQEALANERESAHASVVLTNSRFSVYALLGFAVFLLCVLAVAFQIDYGRREVVRGEIVPKTGSVKILAPQDAVVAQVLVEDGQDMRSGETLFVLNTERYGSSKLGLRKEIANLFEEKVDSLKQEAERTKNRASEREGAIKQKILRVQRELEEIGKEIGIQNKRIELAERVVNKYAELQDSGFISSLGAADKAAALMDQQARLRTLERTQSALSRELVGLNDELVESSFRLAQELALLAKGIGETQQAALQNEDQRQTEVKAPRDGLVSFITVSSGTMVRTGTQLAVLIPSLDALEAELYVPSRSIGFVSAGQIALIKLKAFPYEHYGLLRATIREVSSAPITLDESPKKTASSEGDSYYRVKATLPMQTVSDGTRTAPIRPGMVIEATVVTEKRSLIDWLTKPIRGLSEMSVLR